MDIIPTNDGSDSVFSNQYNASYHSKFGAIEESITIFISSGLYYNYLKGKRKLHIFEMGFGTGLNAFLTAIEAERLQIDIDYTAVELHPLPEELSIQLNYPKTLGFSDLFNRIHQSTWGETQKISEYFKLNKRHIRIEDMEHSTPYDLIYYDAFAPSTQADLWLDSVHVPLFHNLKDNGNLVTYCAQGKFKRMLKAIGYTLESLPGPSHKKEIIRATKTA